MAFRLPIYEGVLRHRFAQLAKEKEDELEDATGEYITANLESIVSYKTAVAGEV